MKTKTKTHGFKVGDRVKSNQPGIEYTGTVFKLDKKFILVTKDNSILWTCRIVGDKVATAYGFWDGKSYLKKITKKPTKKNDSRRKK